MADVQRGSICSSARVQTVADPVAAELEAALALRRSGADVKALRRALRRIEELLDGTGRAGGTRFEARRVLVGFAS